MSPLTWTEPEQSGASECCLYVARRSVDDDEMRVAYRPAAPSDVAAALDAIDEEMAREVFSHPAAMRAGSWIRKMADARHDLATALKRAEAAEMERDEARAKLAELQSRPRHEMTGWGDVDRARIEDLESQLAALRDERRFALVCAALGNRGGPPFRDGSASSDEAATAAVRDADATLALLTTSVQPATPALSPDDAAELEAMRALFRWTDEAYGRRLWLAGERYHASTQGPGVALAATPSALAAKLGAK